MKFQSLAIANVHCKLFQFYQTEFKKNEFPKELNDSEDFSNLKRSLMTVVTIFKRLE